MDRDCAETVLAAFGLATMAVKETIGGTRFAFSSKEDRESAPKVVWLKKETHHSKSDDHEMEVRFEGDVRVIYQTGAQELFRVNVRVSRSHGKSRATVKGEMRSQVHPYCYRVEYQSIKA